MTSITALVVAALALVRVRGGINRSWLVVVCFGSLCATFAALQTPVMGSTRRSMVVAIVLYAIAAVVLGRVLAVARRTPVEPAIRAPVIVSILFAAVAIILGVVHGHGRPNATLDGCPRFELSGETRSAHGISIRGPMMAGPATTSRPRDCFIDITQSDPTSGGPHRNTSVWVGESGPFLSQNPKCGSGVAAICPEVAAIKMDREPWTPELTLAVQPGVERSCSLLGMASLVAMPLPFLFAAGGGIAIALASLLRDRKPKEAPPALGVYRNSELATPATPMKKIPVGALSCAILTLPLACTLLASKVVPGEELRAIPLMPDLDCKPFDIGRARVALDAISAQSCFENHPPSKLPVWATVHFQPNGSVGAVDLDSGNTQAQECLKFRYAAASVPPFCGDQEATVRRFFIVPFRTQELDAD